MTQTTKTLLVTGGAGFIGSNFVHLIVEQRPDWKLVNLDALTYAGNLENLRDVEADSRYAFVKADINDREQVEQAFDAHRPDVVVTSRRRATSTARCWMRVTSC